MNKVSTLGFDKIYVINLLRRPDRKKKLLDNYPGVDFTFIEAVDSENIEIEELIENGKLNRQFLDPNGMITKGVFACALSHKKAWDQALKDNVENALIFEDDIYFPTELVNNGKFTEKYQNIFNEINNIDFDLLFLGKKTATQEGINVGKYLTVPRFNTNHHGAHAYVVTKDMLKELSDNYLPVKYAADVYLEQFYRSHNLFTTRESIIRQISDDQDKQNADSDTYYNIYREGGGDVGISFDQEGNVLNKKIVHFLTHPRDIIDQYAVIVLSKIKFGTQKFSKNKEGKTSFFGIARLLFDLKEKLKQGNHSMAEIYSHTGESTFFFGTSNLFDKIYTIDPYTGPDQFNIDNELTWRDIKDGYHTNTYYFDNVEHIVKHPEEVNNLEDKLAFVYINNRKDEDITHLIKHYLNYIKPGGYIGGDKQDLINFKNKTTYDDGSWLIRKENVTGI